MTDHGRPARINLAGRHLHSAVSSPFGLVIGGVLAFALAVATVLVTLAGTATTTASAATFTYDTPTIARADAHQFVAAEFSPTQLRDVREDLVQRSDEARGTSTTAPVTVVATNTAGSLADEAAGVAFRTDTSHIFRNAAGHLAEDTATNRALIQSAVNPGNLVAERTIGSSVLRSYQQVLPDGRQVWVEVRNGVEITNGGVNAVAK